MYIYSIFLKAEVPLFKLLPLCSTTQIPGIYVEEIFLYVMLKNLGKFGPLRHPNELYG